MVNGERWAVGGTQNVSNHDSYANVQTMPPLFIAGSTKAQKTSSVLLAKTLRQKLDKFPRKSQRYAVKTEL